MAAFVSVWSGHGSLAERIARKPTTARYVSHPSTLSPTVLALISQTKMNNTPSTSPHYPRSRNASKSPIACIKLL
ncbi:hypothetical protein OG21DRAFT_1511351 [Imleria badia]|nr:hypothetical protein OG21DRAFT_1511351 [Imleria badia]